MIFLNLLSIFFLFLPQASIIIRTSTMKPIILNQIQCNNEAYLNLEELSQSFNGGMQILKEERFYRVVMNGKSAYLFKNSSKIVTDRAYSMEKPFMDLEAYHCVPFDGAVKLLKFFSDEEPEVLIVEDKIPDFSGLMNIPQKKTGEKVRIVLDAGHGGEDSGTRNEYGIMEKDITLDISLTIGELLEDSGFDVVYTRDDDVTLPLPHRVAIANSSGGDLLISIHVNYSENKDAKGLEVFFLNSTSSDEEANELAIRENAGYKVEGGDPVVSNIIKDLRHTKLVLMGKELAEHIYLIAENFLDTGRGVKQAPFYILSGAKIPGVLVEVGFLSNNEEGALLEDEEYREKIAKVIFEGIRRFVIEKGGSLYAEKRE